MMTIVDHKQVNRILDQERERAQLQGESDGYDRAVSDLTTALPAQVGEERLGYLRGSLPEDLTPIQQVVANMLDVIDNYRELHPMKAPVNWEVDDNGGR